MVHKSNIQMSADRSSVQRDEPSSLLFVGVRSRSIHCLRRSRFVYRIHQSPIDASAFLFSF